MQHFRRCLPALQPAMLEVRSGLLPEDTGAAFEHLRTRSSQLAWGECAEALHSASAHQLRHAVVAHVSEARVQPHQLARGVAPTAASFRLDTSVDALGLSARQDGDVAARAECDAIAARG